MGHTVKRLLHEKGQLLSGFQLTVIKLNVSNCSGFKTVIQKTSNISLFKTTTVLSAAKSSQVFHHSQNEIWMPV